LAPLYYSQHAVFASSSERFFHYKSDVCPDSQQTSSLKHLEAMRERVKSFQSLMGPQGSTALHFISPQSDTTTLVYMLGVAKTMFSNEKNAISEKWSNILYGIQYITSCACGDMICHPHLIHRGHPSASRATKQTQHSSSFPRGHTQY